MGMPKEGMGMNKSMGRSKVGFLGEQQLQGWLYYISSYTSVPRKDIMLSNV
jgi:hypothetical protein